jgi:surfeit locus 1 family protein
MRRRDLSLLIAGLTVAGACVRLGVWQLHRLHERRVRNHVIATRETLPPVDLATLLAGDPRALRGDLQHAAWRTVICRGRYDTTHTVLLRGRSWEGTPGVEVVSPFLFSTRERVAPSATPSATLPAVLIDRGWLPSSDAETVDPRPFAESGFVAITGVLEPLEKRRDDVAVHALRGIPGAITARTLDPDALGLPYALAPLVVHQLPDARLPRWPRRRAPPALDDGPHLSYAIQWFSFAAVFLAGTMLLIRSRARRSP